MAEIREIIFEGGLSHSVPRVHAISTVERCLIGGEARVLLTVHKDSQPQFQVFLDEGDLKALQPFMGAKADGSQT